MYLMPCEIFLRVGFKGFEVGEYEVGYVVMISTKYSDEGELSDFLRHRLISQIRVSLHTI